MKVPLRVDQLDLKGFVDWLEMNGAIMKGRNNPYEVIRFKCNGVTYVVYRKETGVLTWNSEIKKAYFSFSHNQNWKGFNKRVKRVGSRKAIKKIRDRDGDNCFYCGGNVSLDTETVEHLLSVSHGGSNRGQNLVLAHKKCNKTAGDMGVYEKVLMRERLLREKISE